MKNQIRTAGLLLGLSIFMAVPIGASGPSGTERIENALAALQDILNLPKPEERLPGKLLGKAEGIAIFPGVIKAAWGVGGQYGKGIVAVRGRDGRWSAPLLVSLVGGSVGWQIGVQKSDIILVFKNRRNIEAVAKGKLTLGADASIAAGPVGRQAEAATDWEMESEIYSYAKSKGLFAGVSIKGAAMTFDEDANGAFYGREGVRPEDILAGRIKSVPEIVDRLKEALERAARL
jgi:lipid-binding SYLF domain-containing protein